MGQVASVTLSTGCMYSRILEGLTRGAAKSNPKERSL